MGPLHFGEVELEAFVHATESATRVEDALHAVAPGARIERRALGGHFGQSLVMLRAHTKDPAEVAAIMERIRVAAGKALARSASRRIDGHLRLFLRLDKQEAAVGRIALSVARAHDVIKVIARLKPRGGDREAVIALFQAEFGGDTVGGSDGHEEE